MKSFCAIAFVYSLLFHLQLADGFSTVQPSSLGRSKNRELSSSSFRVVSSTRNPVNSGSVFIPRTLSNNLRATKEEGEGAEEEVDKAETTPVDKTLAGRKKRLTMGYQLASMAYVGAFLFTVSSLIKINELSASLYFFYYVFGGGPLSLAVVLYILKGAASDDRLSSDTYKRLNLAVLSCALVGLAIPTGTMGWAKRMSFKVPAFLALVNTIKGYGYGCLGWDKSKDMSTVLTDVKDGIQSTLKGLTVVKAKSAGYVFGTLLLGSMFCLKLKELGTILFVSSAATATYLSVFTRLSELARFGLMTTIMYSLKDASDRDRLSGTTFVQLNFVAASAFLSFAVFVSPNFGKLFAVTNIPVLVASGLSAMTFFKGLSNRKATNE